MNTTPRSNRTHIAFYGSTNSGKSSLINAITAQETSMVSPVAGTTTDPVLKSMELPELGACVLIDTAGFDDTSELGTMRMELTKKTMYKADIAVIVFDGSSYREKSAVLYKSCLHALKKLGTPMVLVLNKCDLIDDATLKSLKAMIEKRFNLPIVMIHSWSSTGINHLITTIVNAKPYEKTASITGSLCSKDDIVLLVMPQDKQAPKGRLILPQVQTIRDLLDKNCTIICTNLEQYKQSLDSLKYPPNLIITDSQLFKFVYENKPATSKLTSFSVLFATIKGDIDVFLEGAKYIDSLNENSRVLIAEACTHAPITEDIGRVKIPNMLKKHISDKLCIDIVSGSDFTNDIKKYDLIIHCGACMLNQKHLISRIAMAKEYSIPITNYGIAMAYLTGILDKIDIAK